MLQNEDSTLHWENMRNGIENQPLLLEQSLRSLVDTVSSELDGPAPTKIFFVGCGDSYFCGVALRYYAERLTGLPVEALESMEFSRYGVHTAPEGSLVVAVSNSGEVARTVECLKFARERGLRTLAVTYNPESRIAQQADVLVTYDYRDVGFGPGTMSYVASILSLAAVTIRSAQLNGRLDAGGVDAEVARIEAIAPVLRATIAAQDAPAAKAAALITDDMPVFVLGAGPNYGTALFAMAKMIESARHNTVSQQLEEWAHEQFFCCGPDTMTIVLAPRGNGTDRAREQLQAIRDMQGISVVVCAADDAETQALADITLPVEGDVDEFLSPLVYLAAVELIALHFAQGNDKVMLGFDDEFRKQINFRQIWKSTIPDSLVGAGA